MDKIKLFISYTADDIDRYLIVKILNTIKKWADINEIYYWDSVCEGGQSILEYMKQNIAKCSEFLVFCSRKSKISNAVQQEIGMALFSDKPIIPVFMDFGTDVPLNLKDRRGISFPFLPEVEDVIQKSHFDLIKKWQDQKHLPIIESSNDYIRFLVQSYIEENNKVCLDLYKEELNEMVDHPEFRSKLDRFFEDLYFILTGKHLEKED